MMGAHLIVVDIQGRRHGRHGKAGQSQVDVDLVEIECHDGHLFIVVETIGAKRPCEVNRSKDATSQGLFRPIDTTVVESRGAVSQGGQSRRSVEEVSQGGHSRRSVKTVSQGVQSRRSVKAICSYEYDIGV